MENEEKLMETELKTLSDSTAAAPTMSPLQLALEQLRVTPDRQLPPMDFLFQLFGRPCFPRRELVAITGKAKSGKTFVTSMLMACCVVRDVLSFHRLQDSPLRVVWYDTEQSDESTQDILRNRILRMAGQADQIDVFNVRSAAWKDRRLLLLEAVARYAPDLVIVDGIRDLVNDINDGVLAQEVMEELMHLADERNCCICCILHQNKGSEDHNLRGWIGTELMNKAFEVYACEKLMPQRIFKVEQTLTRKYDIDQSLYFEVDAQGLPRLTALPATVTDGKSAGSKSTGEGRNAQPALNKSYIVSDDAGGWHVDLPRLVADVMAGREQMTGGELRQQLCLRANIVSWKFYNKLLAQAVSERLLVKSTDPSGHVVYAPAPF